VGIAVIRFQNHEVFDDVRSVLERIAMALEERRPRM
jgi:very-short-patch-repair endonuclease